ncbi:4'-phosphopantetheinyl transferase superfamily protein [Achromobacter sp. MFA1 R4]|uniref:4'-phosphopantetheinyl transferase family protein n=1 Tax=Achromobacter sp. MFA1 R4 TaxID=1881016 RepID=UPI00095398ED|nr:4'-phosphopantetheinyl transferase superfamily protein [Achromobacter sp. MFA1 R4]SIT33014.1 4'-phosphopantetheinyl transferase [Achromobacter sp. MFA1 R4]
MGVQELLIWWADQSAASQYRVEHLSADDVRRAAAIRSGKALQDWKVSRAVLQHLRRARPVPGATSLSHSGGHAVCATAPPGWKIGIDLEAIRPRNVDGLAQWVCSPDEREALADLQGEARLQHFYRLWTLKEAFIKGAGLDFPADMACVGLSESPESPLLRAPGGAWQACSYRIGSDWVASVVWQAPQDRAADAVAPQWICLPACALPPPAPFGRWRSDSD